MYGYLRVYTPELKVREQEYYRAVYCGLCRTMGKKTGQFSRMTLSYDFTFFALCRMALTGQRPVMHSRRCVVHPTRRRAMADSCEDLELCACLSAVLAYHKVRDDLCDERGLKRTAAAAISPYMTILREKAIRQGHSETDHAVAEAMEALNRLETQRLPSVDTPASLFGNLLSSLLSYGLTGNEAILAKKIGYHVGRWVYILDAADDFERDVKEGRYNPLACLYNDPAMKMLPVSKKEELRDALLAELSELEAAFDLLDTSDDPDLSGILSNILYLGMPAEASRVLFGEAVLESVTES